MSKTDNYKIIPGMRGEAWKGVSWVFYFSIRDSVLMWCLLDWLVCFII